MSVDGNWKITMETPMGDRQANLALKAEGGTLTGSLGGDAGSTPIYDGSISGDKIGFKADITDPMSLTLEFSATVTGSSLSGSVKLGMFGNAPLSGTRA